MGAENPRPIGKDFTYYMPPAPEEGYGAIETDRNFIGGHPPRNTLLRMWVRDSEDWFRRPDIPFEVANKKIQRRSRPMSHRPAVSHKPVVLVTTEEREAPVVSAWERVARRRTGIPYDAPWDS